MAYVTDLTHFDGVLDPGSTAPAPARRLAKFLTEIVRVASRETDNGSIATDVRCFKKPKRRACPGRVVASRERGKETIEWHCPACDEWGVINNWRGGQADLSRFATSGASAVRSVLRPNIGSRT
jgi:hypothetical protein